MITKRPSSAVNRTARAPRTARTAVTASQSITSGAHRRNSKQSKVFASTMAKLPQGKQEFVRTMQNTMRKHQRITAATNTANIMAKPEFMELLPLFVQKLLVLDVYGSVAMKSRQQIIPYFKFVAETTKGQTNAGTILSSPMVNRQGIDPNFTGRVVKEEILATSGKLADLSAAGQLTIAYIPVLPGSVTFGLTQAGVTTAYTDNGQGQIVDASGTTVGVINYSNGEITFDGATAQIVLSTGDRLVGTYQYDNETVGPDENGQYGARMAKGYLDLDEITLRAEAHEIACYWSVYSAFAAQTEYGANIADMAKEAAFSELTAEINTAAFQKLLQYASYKPSYNFDVSPVLGGSVVPSDYLNMFKLTLSNAAASIYQATRLSQPNRIVCGTLVASYIEMINGFKSAPSEDRVGPYKLGTLDQFEIYVDPNYAPETWVMCCKNTDIRRNSALFGEYMPFVNTEAIGLANMSVQQGYATMYAMEIVNPDTIISGKLVGGIA